MYDVTRRILFVLGIVAVLNLASPAGVQAAPVNDAFASAIELIGPIVTTTGDNLGATKQFGGEPSIGPGLGLFGGASVWWKWTASASGSTVIDTEGSSFNTLLGAFTGPAGNQLALVAGNDNYEANDWSRIAFEAVAGTTYYIMVDGFRSGPGFGAPAMGTIVLHVKGVGGLEVVTPRNGAVVTVGEAIPFVVTTDANFPNPPATRVDFYRSGVLFGTSSQAPFTAVATNVPAGSNSFYVVAIDSLGNPIQSGVINVLVQNVGLTLLTPFDGTTFLNTNPIRITAWDYLPEGSITNVEFFVNGQKVGEDATAPFSFLWETVLSGSHRVTAVGQSDSGASYVSQPMNIAVAQVLLGFNSVWKYLDDGSSQGTAWYAPGFDDSAWGSGPAPLGYSDSNGRLPLTTNSFGPDANSKFITTYYRQAFTVGNLSSYSNVFLNIQRDDGAVVYLNGSELARFNMPTGEVTSATFASGNASDDGGTTFTLRVDPTRFVEGVNVLGVEIHQDVGNSSDIWFAMDILGVPPVIYNLLPAVALTTPTDAQYFLAPPSVALEATASDADGSVVRVEFFVDGVKIGEDASSPYEAVWNSPTVGPHRLTAMAVDDQDGRQISSAANVVIYDAVGTPFGRVTGPAEGAAIEGGTNIVVSAYANSPNGVARVEFYSNGTLIGTDDTAPYRIVWDAPFGEDALSVVVVDNQGVRGSSAPVTIHVFPNSTAPTIAAQLPMAAAAVTNLTNITVTFSEPVHNVQASDLLINGVAATEVKGSGTKYLFSFAQPPYGAVAISWASGQGITDFGFPADLPFDGAGPGATWSYTLLDRTPPFVALRTPAAGSLVSNLQALTVTFSEAVSGVDATDLLVSGTPAFSVSGSGATYTFLVSQPNFGTVNVTWSTNSGIFDLSDAPNAFVTGNGGWSFTLDYRTVLVESNAVWHYYKGTGEPTTPTSAWRQRGYELEEEWLLGPAPFYFGDPYTNSVIQGTLLSDMLSNYTTVYLVKEFVVTNRASITNLYLAHQIDDGLVAWLNGVEVLRVNAPAGQVPYNGVATTQANEPNNAGAAYIVASLNNAFTNLVDGTNVLAVHALNQALGSTDFGFNATLYTYIGDRALVAPRIVSATPAGGDVLYLTNIVIRFSEGVSGVEAGDLLINGVAAAAVSSVTNTTYSFDFAQPAYGPVTVSWAAGHGIVDFDEPPKPFDSSVTNATLRYGLFNPINPRVLTQVPLGGTLITGLTQIAVTFTKPVSGVEASDLLLNGNPALAVSSADQTTFQFTVTQPSYGTVSVRWATNHDIQDLQGNAFDPARFGGQWSYNLVNPVPNVFLTSPANNASVLSPVTVRATATDADGTIARVEFFNQAGKIGQATNSPYTFAWQDVAEGPYTLRAVATDNSGLMATSAPVSITVVTSLPIVLVRGPYLQMGTPTSGVVRWRSDLFSDAVVYYGTEPDRLTNVIVRASTTNEHIIQISGLEPDSKYYYSIGNSAQRLAQGADYWFQTSPLPGTKKPTRIWILGDAGTAGNGSPDRQASTRDAFYNYSATNGPTDLWLMLGDNAYNSGTDSEHQAAIFDMYPAMLRNKFLWTTLGNHETAQSTTATEFPYLDIFSLPRNGEAGGTPSGTEKYYSFDYGNIHFVCLDSMTSGRTGTTPMANWLKSDLESTAQEWVIVFFHHSVYTKGTHDSDSESDLVELRQNILPILEDYGVDLVLNGHSHVYERSYLLDGHYGLSSTLTASMKVDGGNGRVDGTGAYQKNPEGRGVVYTIAGSSGQALGGPLNLPAHFISLNELGSVVIDVDGKRLDAQFLNASGAIRDHYTVLKPVPPAAPQMLIARALGSSEIALSWNDAATNELGYVIERSMDGIEYLRLGTNAVNLTNTVDTGLMANTTYYYRVHTFNERGESEPSMVASATTVFTTSAPAAPSGLIVSAEAGAKAYRSQMFLRWQDRSDNEAGFLIERSEDGSAFLPVTTVGANVTAYIDAKLESATDYYYRVSSLNPVADSAPCAVDGDQTHPQSDLRVVGESTVFHAGVEGVAPVRYQWTFKGSPIPGATNEALALASVQATNEGPYIVRVTDANGRTDSNPAWLFVLQPPYMVQQPASTTNVIGGSVTFGVVAAGTDPLFYQWRKDGQNLPGAHDPHFTVGPLSSADTAGYDVVVLNDYGSITSRVARLLVTDNRYPALAALPQFDIDVLQTLVVTNVATDPDSADHLTYVLEAGAPPNATLDAHSGVFRWKPTRAQAPGTNVITVTVHDNGVPNLTDSKSFTVIVNDYLEITIGSTLANAGSSTSSVPIQVYSSAGLQQLQLVLEAPAEHLSGLWLEALQPELVEPLLEMSDPGHALLSFECLPGQVLQGTQQVAQLHFTAGALSAFAPLKVKSLNAIMDNPELYPALLANDGRVAIIGSQGLLEAIINGSGVRQLVIYGKVGTNYTVQSRFGIGAGTSWTTRNAVTLTNPVQTLVAPSAGSQAIIHFRLRQ